MEQVWMCMEMEGSDALKGIQTVKKVIKKERGGTCLILELMHRLSFLPNDSDGKVYSYVRPN